MSDTTDTVIGDQTGKLHTEKWTYLGRRYYGSKLYYLYKREDGSELVTLKSPFPRWAGPGSIFEFTVDEQERFFTKGPKAPRYIGPIESKNERTDLELQDQIAITQSRQITNAKKMSILLLERRLAPIRREYKRLWMVPESQAALLAAVIREITS